jgi:uncharacterized coiled-coil DUF342 family protein
MRALVVSLAIVATAGRNTSTNTSTGKSMEDYKAEKAAEAKDAAGVAAKDAKMAAVNKVVAMLEGLQAQVLEEGEKEAATYNKFACFCKTTMTEKQEAIKTGKDDKASLSASITKLSATRKDLDTKIGVLQSDIKTAEGEMKKATAESDAALAVYETNEADLSGALGALAGAIKMVKSSKNPSLLQLQGISKTVRQAVVMADALGLDVPGLAMLQDAGAPDVEMENYKFHSDSIVETLEKLQAEFIKEKNTVDASEVKRVQAYHMVMQEQTDLVKAKTVELDDRQHEKAKTSENIGIDTASLTTTSANLLDDMDYLSELYDISSAKAKTWDQRSKVRADELSALTSAIEIVKTTVAAKTRSATIRFGQVGVSVRLADAVAANDDAMESIEEAAEEAEGSPMGFLQRVQVTKHAAAPADRAVDGRQAVAQLLKSQGQQLKSPLLVALASEVANQNAADVFAKVKVLIQELIERLLNEASNEANHQGWCSKAIADATQKRSYASDEIAELNADLADDEAKLDKLKEELGTLGSDIAELKKTLKDAADMRKAEKAENKETVTEAEAGMSATQSAITILTRFYATAAKEKVDLSLAQGPADDMPDAGFDSGEAYTGVGGEGGVVGMLEVIQSDFVRTIKETQKAESEAEEAYLELTTDTGKSLAQKEMAQGQTKKYHDSTEIKLEKDNESLTAQVTILKTSIKELLELQPACVDTGMSYADRVGKREQEIGSLKKALCILEAYASFGPDGLADAC